MSKTIPPKCPEPESGPKYWRSLDELSGTPEFNQWLEREFPQGASEFTDPVSRRQFVKLMSASFLLAGVGLTGCRRPVEKILPFSKMPENYIHGVPQYYATSMPNRGSAIPLVAKSNDGRPTKVEGNSLLPDSNGATDAFAQASVLNLYDVDRSMRFAKAGVASSREAAFEALAAIAAKAKSASGDGLCFLAESSSSPSRARLVRDLAAALPKARWFEFEPVDFPIHQRAATLAFGRPATPVFRFDAAKVIVSLDCDFLGTELDAFQHIRRFAQGRKLAGAHGSMSRLYAAEALMTLTGANADHRLRLPASSVVQLAAALAAEVVRQSGSVAGAGSSGFGAAIAALGKPPGVDAQWIQSCAKDLLSHKGESLVVAGVNQPLAVHLLAAALNEILGNTGKTVRLLQTEAPSSGSLTELAQALNAGQVETLVVLGGNPVYNAPADLDWAKTQRKAKTVVRLGYYEDETTGASDWHLPLAHYLESWGDARTSDGTVVPVQPLIEPLFGGITELEVISRIAGRTAVRPHDIVRETFGGLVPGADAGEAWKKFLHDGFLAGSAAAPVEAAFNWDRAANAVAAVKAPAAPGRDKLEVVFHRDYKVDDGRYTNNGWLQELPDPITKMVWENLVLLSKKTADDLGLVIADHEDNNLQVPLVRVTLGGRTVEGPAWIQPGMADNVLGLALGYGRLKTGRISRGSGFNAYSIRTSAAPAIAAGASLASTGTRHKLSTTQNHWAMEGRPVVREANLDQYRKHPHFAKGMNMHEAPKPPGATSWPAPLYPNPLDVAGADGKSPRDRAVHAWGMSIDLNSCVGCSACVVACQSENNIPIVGKDQVSRNREMHWLRIDRYYAGGVEDPQVVNQPMLCQHCEAAPCESVCPVNATVHDEEGLNVMAYNRCVGTRYCSNNCPYKVRRFNYLDFNRRPLDQVTGPFYASPLVHKTDGEWDMKRWWKNPDRGYLPDEEWELLKLAKNPDVTVRMRGVMEKCSFCLQRIEQAKITRKVKAGASGDIEVPDGTIKTACQQACPAEAIVFGNVKDPGSLVSKLKQSDRDYSVLEFLLTKPRTTYLARVRNPNPDMPGYEAVPATFREWEAQGNSLADHDSHATGSSHGSGAAHGAPQKGAH